MKKVITVENLSKQYEIFHNDRDPYLKFSDLLYSTFKSLTPQKKKRKKSSENFFALKNINFDISQGDRVGIIGSNGAGKSTLLKILSKIVAPTTGNISIEGRVSSLLEVGTGFHPELSGRENIYLNGAILGMSRREINNKFDEIVAFAETEKFIDTPVKKYSSGMYMRLAFSIAAHLEPEILIIDEVLAVGDAAFQKKCLGKIEESGREGRTILFVSHNMASISLLCNKAILLSQGEIKLIGNTDKVINAYLENRNEETQLNHRIDRSGNGIARVNEIDFFDESGKSVDKFKISAPINILLTVKSKPEGINKKIFFSLIVVDRHETRILSMQNEVIGTDFVLNKTISMYKCNLPDGLPLVPGSYSITFSLVIGGDTADKVSAAKEFEIIGTDFYSSGRLPSNSLGSFLVKNNWSTI